MTRFLSDSLQAPEPFFRLGLKRLEGANGNPNADIRFSTEVLHASRDKLRQLGLDPYDTTAAELYHALHERVKTDDTRLTRTLQTLAATHVSAEADVVAGMVHALKDLPDSKRCYGLKASSLKVIIKKVAPRRALKQLGYRSLESCLKHESPVLILTAAWLVEGEAWQRRFLDQYKQLSPSDFENRSIAVLHPTSARWQKLAKDSVELKKHNLVSFKELGALVFLPFTASIPAGAVTASLSLALHELNEIRATSAFLKLCQVRNNFGSVVKAVATDEPRLSSQLLDQPVPWHMIQRYYSRFTQHFREEVFEPHLQIEDMAWHPIEETLTAIEPAMEFWKQSSHIGMLHGHHPVSFNVIDAAINYCNQLPFEKRIVRYFQRSLWHELLLRYLRHDKVERSVLSELQPQLATETALA